MAKQPALALLYHVPNEGKRTLYRGRRMKEQGLRAGVPDLCLPVARGGYHGLYIELKRTRGGRVSPQQREWLANLTQQGYRAEICRGWMDASQLITEYLGGIDNGKTGD